MIKFVGIIKDHENFRVKLGHYIKDLPAPTENEDYLGNVVFYLEHGVRLFAFLEEVFDENTFIDHLYFIQTGHGYGQVICLII